MPEYEPYELAYYRESDRADRAEREVVHIEEERDIVKEQLGNWQSFGKNIKPHSRGIQISWCDLCVHRDFDSPEQCADCTMGANFKYDEVTFGEIDEWNK